MDTNRISRKRNISAAREQWGLGLLKCSMGRMECYKTGVYHVGKHSRPTPRLAHVIFLYIIDLLVTDRVSQGLLSLFAFTKII